MIYLKSVLAGLIALIVVPILLIGIVIVGTVIYTSVHRPQGEGSIGWDPVSFWNQTSPLIWFVPVLIFGAGFIWEYRRLAR